MRRNDEPDREDVARSYLAHAMKCADLVNAVEMPRIGENTDPMRVARIAAMNALVAIAITQVPEERYGARLL
ncbi:hypothetical protein SEA_KELA_174 [Streptomyces phage Kela]|jgi:hypothetical protein|nr:hypothetical protein SEA_JUSTBECAUSE_176 [Streptomyces phage JustBecause]QJD53744.1 hypothetical protein SEA_KELA_174 [Streptomyces phage Kela]